MVFILKIFRQHPMLLDKFISKLRILGLFDPGRQILLVLAVQTQSQLTTVVLPIAGGEQWDQKRLDLEPTRKIHKVSFMSFAFGIFWVWCKNKVKWKSQTRWHDIMMYTIVPKLRLG